MAARGDRLAQTFVDVADTLVADFDIVDFLTVLTVRCVELFDLAAAGLLLSDAADGVRVAASSNDRMQLLELFELQYDEGPCLDSYRTGQRVQCDDLSDGGRAVAAVRSRGAVGGVRLGVRAAAAVAPAGDRFVEPAGRPAAARSTNPGWSRRRRWPTSPPSASCNTGPPPSNGCSLSSCSTRCRAASSSSRRRGSSPSSRASRWTTRSPPCGATHAITTSVWSTSPTRWWNDGCRRRR